jgi:hypothetical protein
MSNEEWFHQSRCPNCESLYIGKLDELERFFCSMCASFVYPASSYYGPMLKHPPTPESESAEVGRLLPCPFCGGSDLDTDYGYNRVYVRCNNPKCYADGPITGETRETGTAAWNLRSHPTPEREGREG